MDAKSDTNEIKLMVTDHAEGNRILSALYIIVPLVLTIPTIGLNSRETRIVLFYSDWMEDADPYPLWAFCVGIGQTCYKYKCYKILVTTFIPINVF